MNADTMQEYWRTYLPGSIGFYNSILVTDRDDDNSNELYVAGSQGLWKFVEV